MKCILFQIMMMLACLDQATAALAPKQRLLFSNLFEHLLLPPPECTIAKNATTGKSTDKLALHARVFSSKTMLATRDLKTRENGQARERN